MYQKEQYYPQNYRETPEEITIVDYYVVETLKSVISERLVVDTTRGAYQGTLVDVKPDHIVLSDRQNDHVTFIRIQQIVSIMVISK